MVAVYRTGEEAGKKSGCLYKQKKENLDGHHQGMENGNYRTRVTGELHRK